MAETSVIQMPTRDHFKAGEDTLISALHMHKAGLPAPMTTEEAAAYAAGFEKGWRLSMWCILRDGNCRFEVHHG